MTIHLEFLIMSWVSLNLTRESQTQKQSPVTQDQPVSSSGNDTCSGYGFASPAQSLSLCHHHPETMESLVHKHTSSHNKASNQGTSLMVRPDHGVSAHTM